MESEIGGSFETARGADNAPAPTFALEAVVQRLNQNLAHDVATLSAADTPAVENSASAATPIRAARYAETLRLLNRDGKNADEKTTTASSSFFDPIAYAAGEIREREQQERNKREPDVHAQNLERDAAPGPALVSIDQRGWTRRVFTADDPGRKRQQKHHAGRDRRGDEQREDEVEPED